MEILPNKSHQNCGTGVMGGLAGGCLGDFLGEDLGEDLERRAFLGGFSFSAGRVAGSVTVSVAASNCNCSTEDRDTADVSRQDLTATEAASITAMRAKTTIVPRRSCFDISKKSLNLCIGECAKVTQSHVKTEEKGPKLTKNNIFFQKKSGMTTKLITFAN